jgi:hypothetical protein
MPRVHCGTTRLRSFKRDFEEHADEGDKRDKDYEAALADGVCPLGRVAMSQLIFICLQPCAQL